MMKHYKSVRILDKQFPRSGITYKVQFDASKFRKTRWAHSKQLIYGSFLCLSKDNFQTMLFATVANRDPDELKKGRFDIRLIEEQDTFGLENSGHLFQMVESPAYFEAYRHVLKGLKELDEDSLPFKKYLVECSADVDPPNYLRPTGDQRPVYYDLSKALDNKTSALTAVNILQPDAWPSAKDLCLNNSQLEALKTAITTEFCVIQGPPGTGKTYVGAKIVKCLLDNHVHWAADHASPMLMVCYTNHALDQFLEKVLDFVPSHRVIRVGGRCKSKQLESCNLKKCAENRRRSDRRSEIESKLSENKSQIRKSRNDLQNADKRIMEFDDLVDVINDNHTQQLVHARFPRNAKSKCQKVANTFHLWLCNYRYMNNCNNVNRVGGIEEREHQDGSILEDMEVCESAIQGDAFYADVTDSQSWLHDTVNGFQCYPKGTNEQSNQELYSCYRNARLNNHEPGSANIMPMEVEDETSFHRTTGCDESRDTHDEGDCFSFSYKSTIENTFMEGNFLTEGKGRAPRKQKCGKNERWPKLRFNNNITFSWQQKGTKSRPKSKKLQLEATEKDICCVQEQLKTTETMTAKEVAEVVNVWLLSSTERLGLYRYWLECYRERCKMEIEREEQTHEQLCCDLEAVRAEKEEHVLSRATVVGMTTSCAARYHTMLQRIAPKIVVIEEAAEVMEAHIITSLSRDTEHTILIGDHKQLRPKAAVYELAQKYNLEISLFERMIMNKMECKCLTIQHRMRPEIAELTKRIYDHEILDHESVSHFDDILGVGRNLFFIDHCEPESFMSSTQSYCNCHEAEFLAAFCNYLLLQGYRKEQITVLTMYTGQVLELKEKMPKRKFQRVKICAVDNYQGEENDIILLSLVRSNKEESIGFLKESNRICVALSRARLGFYCIGNFRLLSSQSKLWKEICDDLKVKGAIGEKLQLVCVRHKNINDVRTSDDFERLPDGGCQEACEYRLECGHACDKPCHSNDLEHKKYQCNKQCFQRCSNEHQCQRMCHYSRASCGLCQVNCEKELSCGHRKTLPCYQDPTSSVTCDENCSNILECGHPCLRKCSESCQCDSSLELELPCKHRSQVLCREKDHPPKCPSRCQRYLECGHNCPGICSQDCSSLECQKSIPKTLPRGHQKTVPCYLDPAKVFCLASCKRKLNCGHPCPAICGVECERGLCSEIVSITLKCNHEQMVRCGGSTENVTCTSKCNRQCKRGHPCQKKCHGNSACEECNVLVNMTIPFCNHNVEVPCHTDPTKLKCIMPCERLKVCDHPCSGICGEDCADCPCKMIVTKTLHCGHTVSLPCYKKPEEHKCEEDVEVELSCGHKKTVICSTLESGKHSKSCHVKELKVLPCKHQTFLPCSAKPEEHSCKEKVEVKLPCGHKKFATCSILKTSFQMEPCEIMVPKLLPCNHTVQVKCSENKERQLCKAPCAERLSCGHPCPGRCGEDCRTFKCDKKVQKHLPCLGRHQVNVLCSDDLNLIDCYKRCSRKLRCGHPCPGKCHEDCSQFKCKEQCTKLLECGHPCPGLCWEDCTQIYPCKVPVIKTLRCGHRIQMFCGHRPSNVRCPASCGVKLDCGHLCSGICGACQERGSHKLCRRPCSRQLLCSHLCEALCCEPCPPCDKQCRRRCPHGRCTGRCSEPCRPCILPCAWTCPHYQCNNLCMEICDRPPCNARCSNRLSCGHQCIGLCGENCPTICGVCHEKQLSFMSVDQRGNNDQSIAFLQLFDCGHLKPVAEMDKWMQQDLGSDVEYWRCPDCPTPITFSYRYGRRVKRILENVENVKKQAKELTREAASACIDLRLRAPYNRMNDFLSSLPVYEARALGYVKGRNVLFLFTLKNQLSILWEIQRTQQVLVNTVKEGRLLPPEDQKSQKYRDIEELSGNTAGAMEQMEQFLQHLHLDLRTHSQLYEDTRKFFLFSYILEAEVESIKHQTPFTLVGERNLRLAQQRFKEFLQGNNSALGIERLETIVNSLRKEVNLQPLPASEVKDFENFPGYSIGVWKLCRQGHVFVKRSIVRCGEDLPTVLEKCHRCEMMEFD